MEGWWMEAVLLDGARANGKENTRLVSALVLDGESATIL